MARGIQRLKYSQLILTDVLDYHKDDHLPFHKKLENSLNHNDDLIKNMELANNQTVAITVNGYSITHSTLHYFLIICSSILVIFLYVKFYKYRQNKNKNIPATRRQVEGETTELRTAQTQLFNQLTEQSRKLDSLLRTANEIETCTIPEKRIGSQRRSRRTARAVTTSPRRYIELQPQHHVTQCTAVPSIFD